MMINTADLMVCYDGRKHTKYLMTKPDYEDFVRDCSKRGGTIMEHAFRDSWGTYIKRLSVGAGERYYFTPLENVIMYPDMRVLYTDYLFTHEASIASPVPGVTVRPSKDGDGYDVSAEFHHLSETETHNFIRMMVK